MGYDINNNIDKGYFQIKKSNKVNKSINYLLNNYNIDLNDYWILKCSNRFRFIDIETIDKYSAVICFNKEIFNKEDIDKWLDFHNSFDYRLKYLIKPFPPIEILNKIKLVEDEI